MNNDIKKLPNGDFEVVYPEAEVKFEWTESPYNSVHLTLRRWRELYECEFKPELRPTVKRKDCRCSCHHRTDTKHSVPCCIDFSAPPSAERDMEYFYHRLALGLNMNVDLTESAEDLEWPKIVVDKAEKAL